MNTQSILKIGVAAILFHTVARAENPNPTSLAEAFGEVPLGFEANQGQTDPAVRFLSRGNGYTVFLTSTEAVLRLTRKERVEDATSSNGDEGAALRKRSAAYSTAVVRMNLVGANPNPKVTPVDALPGAVSYLTSHPENGATVTTEAYRQVLYENVWPGVYLVYYGNQRQLEYDFVVAPGVLPSSIRLSFEGAQNVKIDDNGDLVLTTSLGDLRQHAPVVYQADGEVRTTVHGRYTLLARNRIGFEIGNYDATKPLIIDPVLSFKSAWGDGRTWGGHGDDVAAAVAVDKRTGEIYVAGYTDSADFPVKGFQTTSRKRDAFVSKIDPTGTKLVFSTYLGGSWDDAASGIALDDKGNAYVTGWTNSQDFPRAGYTVTRTYSPVETDYNFFVAKIDSNGRLLYSEQFGGSGNDYAYSIAVDSKYRIYVVGQTASYDFKVVDQYKSYLRGPTDGFLAVISLTSGQPGTIVHSRYLGGDANESAKSVALMPYSGNYYPDVFIAGWTSSLNFPKTDTGFEYGGGGYDGFALRLRLDPIVHILPGPSVLSRLVYSTCIGGENDDMAFGIAVDAAGSAYITGYTRSGYFITYAAFQKYSGGHTYGVADAFVVNLDPDGNIHYATYFGGSGEDFGRAIAIDNNGNAYVTGYTESDDLYVSKNAKQQKRGGDNDAFFFVLEPGGAVPYSTYIGRWGDEEARALALDGYGNVYIVGFTDSTSYGDSNAMILKFSK